MLAPAMAWCPALLTAAPRRRRGCLTAAGAPGSLLAAAPPRPPFPQALPQFLELRTRRLQFLFQPLLSLYRLAMHSAVVARLPALLYYLAPQLGYLAPACRRAPIRTSPESSHTSFLSTPFRLCPELPHRYTEYLLISVTCRRPFSELGDQQLLEQTKRLAANQRCLEVHILDHLDEIDRRGLALRRGFSSLFDYAVRELRFTDAAAQRRIQAMRLCRRHGWVRASLQSGELSMTAAAQLETTFAGAERAERQSRTAHRNVGQTSQLGLPAAPGEAGEQGERGPRSAPELAPPAGECAGDAAAVNTRVAPVASHAVAQDPGAGHAGAVLPRPELNGDAAPFPAPSCNPVAVPAAPSSDEGPAPQLLPPTNLPASAPVPVSVVAPSESLPPASLAPESSGHDPFAELSPGPSSSAPLLHPQRQRELIEQAAGMSTRQVAVLLAAAAPEVVPPRDTLRAVAPDRYTLKVTIDQECEQGLRRLKGLLSHIDPRMSWGDLVARLVREAVARHDPRGGGSGQRRRRSAGSAGASPRPAPNKTRAAGAADAPAQRVHESSRRASKTRRPAGAAAGPVQRVSESSRRAPNRTRAAAAPAAPAQRGGGATPAPQADTAATERQNPIAMLANAAPPSQSGPAALLDGARADGVPSGAPAAAAAPQSGPAAPLDGARGGGAPSGAPAATAAPKFASDALADGSHAGAAVPGSPVATSAAEPVLGVFPDGGPSDASAGAAAHTTRDSVHNSHQSPPRRHIPAAVRRHVWQRDGGRCCYRDPLTGRRCTSSHLLQIDHLLPVAQGGGPEPFNLNLLCAAHHRMRHGHGSAAPSEPPM